MTNEKLEAIQVAMDKLSDEALDDATVCLLAAERGDLETFNRHEARLVEQRRIIRECNTMIMEAVVKAQTMGEL